MNTEKIHGENVYVNFDEVIETVYQCRRDEANDDWVKRWFEPLASLPTIEVSEDCISREWVKGICEAMLDEEMLGHMLGYIEDAPSVLPQPKEGEWIDRGDYAECSICGAKSGTQFDGVQPIPLKTKFCSNCRAKMKG